MTYSAHHREVSRPDVQLVVVVLAYGAGDEVAGLLGYLHAESLATGNAVIVLHNPSDSSDRLMLSSSDDVRVVELGTNGGYVGGMNAGIDLALKSSPEFVLLLTHDVRIAAQEVHELHALMRAHADLAAMGPILCRSGDGPYSAGFIRDHHVRMRHRVPVDDMPRPVWPCSAIDGSVMMWRATALKEVRGFDERFFMYFDDLDICARARRCGWEIAVATELRALSAPGGSHRRSAHAYLRARNGLAYARTFGLTGLLAGLVECAAGLWHMTPKPGGKHFYDPEARKIATAYWRGTTFGVFDYFRGRWGPPPPLMMQDSDIAATST